MLCESRKMKAKSSQMKDDKLQIKKKQKYARLSNVCFCINKKTRTYNERTVNANETTQ